MEKVIGIKLHAFGFFRFAVSKIAPGIHHRFQRKDRLLSRDKSHRALRLRKSYYREFYCKRDRFLSPTWLSFSATTCSFNNNIVVLLLFSLSLFFIFIVRVKSKTKES